MYYPWTPSDMFHSTKKTREYFSELFDKYGDNYYEEVDCDKLKSIFSHMSKSVESLTNNSEEMHYKIAFIENKYFPDESSDYGLFRLLNVYLDLYEKSENNREKRLKVNSRLDLIKLKLCWYGSAISEEINDSTTHCVLDNRLKILTK